MTEIWGKEYFPADHRGMSLLVEMWEVQDSEGVVIASCYQEADADRILADHAAAEELARAKDATLHDDYRTATREGLVHENREKRALIADLRAQLVAAEAERDRLAAALKMAKGMTQGVWAKTHDSLVASAIRDIDAALIEYEKKHTP